MKISKEVYGIGKDREKNGYKLVWFLLYFLGYMIYDIWYKVEYLIG